MENISNREHRVFIIDDQRIMRARIKNILDEITSVKVVGEASDGYEALMKLKNIQADVILLDMTMPAMSGIEFLEKYNTNNNNIRIIVISSFGDKRKVMEAIELGASNFINRPIHYEKLKHVINYAC